MGLPQEAVHSNYRNLNDASLEQIQRCMGEVVLREDAPAMLRGAAAEYLLIDDPLLRLDTWGPWEGVQPHDDRMVLYCRHWFDTV